MGPSLKAEIYTNQLGWAHPLIAPQNQNGVTSNCGKKWLTYVPKVEKKSRPENSSSRIPTVPLLPFPRPPCSDFLWSGWLNPLNTWSWPAYLVYNLWSWRRDSLAPLATIRAMSQSFLFFFFPKGEVSFFENALRALKWLFFAGLWGQQLFPVHALKPTATRSNSGASLLFSLSPHTSKMNKYLPDNSQLICASEGHEI